jgi:Na+/H+ antiporter NhaD/arsenite permease-like protein
MNKIFIFFAMALISMIPALAFAAGGEKAYVLHIETHPGAIFCLAVFILSYIAVLFEERTHLRKSKPVMLGAGIIWLTIGIIAKDYGVDHHVLRSAIFHGLEEYSSLLLFLLAAMTYISALQERRVFATLRVKLVQAGFNMKQLFWATGIIAFFLSPIADNLTTSLVLGAVIMAVGANNPKFIAIACVNVVNAANAGGAFSPFGDITTLMVWQAQKASFFEFFALFLPSVACFIVPAFIMSFFVSSDRPWAVKDDTKLKRGAIFIIFLGLSTIAMAVSFEQFLGLPPFLGMMTGLSLLMITAWYIRKIGKHRDDNFDILELVAASEWDTLLFFFGVIFSVGGLTFIGYMELASHFMYDGWGASITNIIMGLASAIVDNIPVMFAVLSMDPQMDKFQWLLITLTTGVGGSLLSIGSAAGVALMGVARGQYTFFSHLKWTPILALGYIAAIGTHFIVNG